MSTLQRAGRDCCGLAGNCSYLVCYETASYTLLSCLCISLYQSVRIQIRSRPVRPWRMRTVNTSRRRSQCSWYANNPAITPRAFHFPFAPAFRCLLASTSTSLVSSLAIWRARPRCWMTSGAPISRFASVPSPATGRTLALTLLAPAKSAALPHPQCRKQSFFRILLSEARKRARSKSQMSSHLCKKRR